MLRVRSHENRRIMEPTRLNGSPSARQRGRVLIVDRDALARWSISTYLQRWFAVQATECAEEAERLLDGEPLVVLIVSDDMPGRVLERLERRVQARCPEALVVRTVTGVRPKRPRSRAVLLEKPYQLHELAACLGVPASEVHRPERA